MHRLLPLLLFSLFQQNARAQASQQANLTSTRGPGNLTVNPAGDYDLSQIGTLASSGNTTYKNPIMSVKAGDPWMTTYDSYYLFTFSTNSNITLKRSHSLTSNWDFAETKVVFNPDPDGGQPWSLNLWAPEIHRFGDRWYIIFSPSIDGDDPNPLQDAMCPYACPAINHRMYVLESSGPDPWESEYTVKSELSTFDSFAIDGTYMTYGDKLYHLYSCWEHPYDGWPANLCITTLSNPWTTASTLTQRRLLSVPRESWEQVPPGRYPRLATNEGPAQLTNPYTNQTFVVYSAARVNTPFYCLGLLELVGNDPMQPQNWKKHTDGCVFSQNTVEGVYGTGHASFVRTLGDGDTYVVYHALTTDDPGRKSASTASLSNLSANQPPF